MYHCYTHLKNSLHDCGGPRKTHLCTRCTHCHFLCTRVAQSLQSPKNCANLQKHSVQLVTFRVAIEKHTKCAKMKNTCLHDVHTVSHKCTTVSGQCFRHQKTHFFCNRQYIWKNTCLKLIRQNCEKKCSRFAKSCKMCTSVHKSDKSAHRF